MGKQQEQEEYYLKLAALGDREGLTYLVNAYRNLAYTIAYKILYNREDAEEVVQDAFLKAFAALRNFNRAAKFSTWLYRIVYNTALTKKSNRPITAESLNEHAERIDIPYHVDGLTGLYQADRKRYVEQALAVLKPDDRLAITLHYLAEKSISETGEIMGLRSSAVKMRLLRARAQLEKALNNLLKTEINELR